MWAQLFLALALTLGVQSSKNTTGQCYTGRGHPKFCRPEYENQLPFKGVTATSTYGNRTIRICGDMHGRRICKERPSPVSLLDDHNKDTCWALSILGSGETSVNLTVSLGKKFFVEYGLLQNCRTRLPDDVEVYKSTDFGITWHLWYVFSKDCPKRYGLPGREYFFFETLKSKEIVCININSLYNKNLAEGYAPFAFLTYYHRELAIRTNSSDPSVMDWSLATDVRFVLKRHPMDNGEMDREPFSFSELSIGGRCFCNGHASLCKYRKNKLTCDCEHGTDGDDCDRCSTFWGDLPWERSTVGKPTACKECQCNSHSTQCKFDAKEFELSGKVSGGICLNCQHHTVGKNCHRCQAGYYRRANTTIDSPFTCRMCNCHLNGSRDQTCNHETGQCNCKMNVIGLKCDKCADGFEQSSSFISPCVPRTKQQCRRPCQSHKNFMTQKDFCLRKWAFKVHVMAVRRHRRWIRIKCKIQTTFKCPGQCKRKRRKVTLWVRQKSWRCKCPIMQQNATYFVLTRNKQRRRRGLQLVLDRHSFVWLWNPTIPERLKRLATFPEQRGACTDCKCVRRKIARDRRRNSGQRSAATYLSIVNPFIIRRFVG